jgi:hypothetical protein
MKNLSTAMWFFQENEHKKSNLKGPFYLRKSGEGWAFNRVEAGLISGFISKCADNYCLYHVKGLSHIYCCSGDHLGLIQGLEWSIKNL